MQVWSDTVVVALHLGGGICPATKQCYGSVAAGGELKREDAIVLDEDDALLGGLECQCFRRGGSNIRPTQRAIWSGRSRVKVTQLDESSIQAYQGLVDDRLVE